MKTSNKSVLISEKINFHLDRFMPLISPLGVILGFVFHGFFIHLLTHVIFLFCIITLSGALKMKVLEFGKTMQSPLPILAFLASAHVVMPLVAFAVSSLFFKTEPDTIAGFILLYSGPTAVSTFIWVGIFRGDKALCLTIILLVTLLTPILTPFSVSFLMGAYVSMNMKGMAISLILMIVVPTIIGVTINEASRGKIPAIVSPYLNPLSKICLILVIAANTSPLAERINFSDPKIWTIAGLTVLLTLLTYPLSRLAALVSRCNPEKTVTLFFTGGLRNNTVIAAIAVAFFLDTAALPATICIMFQQPLSALMGKLVFRKHLKNNM